MKCIKCNTEIKIEDINVQKDIAKCYNCGNVFTISTRLVPPKKFDVSLPPQGAWHISDFVTTTVGATTRSPIAFFLVPFMIVWSGFALGGIYGQQILSGKFNLVLSLFGIPFLLGSILFWSIAMMAIFGKVVVTFDNVGGKIFTGIGKIGFTKSFNWNDVNTIEETTSSVKYNSKSSTQISLLGQKRTSFGAGLNDERRYFILGVLNNYLNSLKR